MSYDVFKNITIHQMESLVQLIAEGSFSRAAKKLFLTQPALTKHIKNMEDSLGIRLVNRGNGGVSLTPEGKILYDYARRIIKLREEAKEKILQIRENESGSIYIGASTIPATYILPYVLSDFKKIYPAIRVNVQAADSEETVEIILNNQAEIGFIGKKPLHRKLHVEPLWEDRLILAVPGGHRWAGKGPVTLDELSREPFVLREKGSATREVLETYLKENTGMSLAQFNIVGGMGSSEAVKEAIIAGLGVSALSIHAVGRELRQGVVVEVPIEGCRVERCFYLIHRRQFSLMRHHCLFLNFVRGYKL
ncbi:MAG: selenium metabolism-associated LysR family transcriptional regulator [Syntrophales bacterium]|nr:selenium metabolism-associated LysR family transcriptional regulator [Syntrophales bacterium]